MLGETLKYLNADRKNITHLFESMVGEREQANNGFLERAVSSSKETKFEFIIVDDGSTDGTKNVVLKYVTTNMQNGDIAKLVSMNENCGKGGAVKTGMLQSSGQLCLMVDADGATDISDGLPKLMKSMIDLTKDQQSGNESGLLPPAAVFGSRAHLAEESSASRSKVRTFLMHAFHFFVKTLCSSQIHDTQCGFKLFTRSAAVMLFTNLHLRRWAFDTEAIVIAEKLNVPVTEVGVVWNEVDGSKLDEGKIALALASLGMLRDMLCVRACYCLGIWKLKR